jgi:transposase
MATAYSADMRLRVIGRVESGASRREAAEHYEVSPSTAVIWVKCFRETGRCAAKPRGWEHVAAGEARGLVTGADRSGT